MGREGAGLLEDEAVSLAEAGDTAGAVPLLQRAAALLLPPDDGGGGGAASAEAAARVLELLAQCLMEEEGRGEEALAAAQQAAGLHPESPAAQLTLGRAARNVGRLPAAVAAFRACAQLLEGQAAGGAELAGEAREGLQEAVALAEREAGHAIGLPGLRIAGTLPADGGSDGGLGPAGRVWDSGLLLARLLVDWSAAPAGGMLAGASVLELGSGLGVVGLAAACLGACVCLTDLPAVLPALRANVALNQSLVAAAGGSAEVAALDWHSPDAALLGRPHAWLLGADLAYSPAAAAALAEVVAAAVGAAGGELRVALAHKRRSDGVDAALLGGLEARGVSLRPAFRDASARIEVLVNGAAARAIEGAAT